MDFLNRTEGILKQRETTNKNISVRRKAFQQHNKGKLKHDPNTRDVARLEKNVKEKTHSSNHGRFSSRVNYNQLIYLIIIHYSHNLKPWLSLK